MNHRTAARSRIALRFCATLLVFPPAGAAGAAEAQAGVVPAPFAPGEVLTYRAVSGRFGSFGTGTMRVEGPVDIRGQSALQLSFDFRGRVGVFRVQDRTRSWISVGDLSSLRYEKKESSPIGSHTEEVEIFPEEGRWEAANGTSGETECMHPLDELSFLYHVRSLPLVDGAEFTLTHHFDPSRNPVALKVLRRETVDVPAGVFATVVVEMRVRDERVSAMTLYLTDDEARIPVRIESSAKWVGSTRLLLESVSGSSLARR
jgi:hypothetical protein